MNESSIKAELNSTSLLMQTGFLKRILTFHPNSIYSMNISIHDKEILSAPNLDFSLRISQAIPNQSPPQLSEDKGKVIAGIEQDNQDHNGTDGLNIKPMNKIDGQIKSEKLDITVQWENPFNISNQKDLKSLFDISTKVYPLVLAQNLHSQHIEITLRIKSQGNLLSFLNGIIIVVHYNIYSPYPVIEKWIEIQNTGEYWLRIDNFQIEDLTLDPALIKKVDLTPQERGAQPSIMAYVTKSDSKGIIFVSEIPSSLRSMTPNGTMGYSENLFEWILGPKEIFMTEKTWLYAIEGDVQKTISAISTPLDRTIEGPFQQFLLDYLHFPASTTPIPGPVWCTWTNLSANINDMNIREQADIAAKIGFRTFQMDAGWADSTDPSDWTAGGAEPNKAKFPLFEETCKYIQSKGMQLGLWLSCFRPLNSKDLRDNPNARVLPWIKRGKCVGMSFASPWKEYYANDVISLSEKYGVKYFKQDLTNIKYGDIAQGHEGRTLKDSVLRGLRGFLFSQELIHKKIPMIWTMISHELYWGTPGVPCDLASIKSICGYHIPPNDYSGAGLRSKRWSPSWRSKFEKELWSLLLGCWHARQRYYAMRALPLYCLEYYGAATVNIQNSLTVKVQDRQICSWLMGMPSVYAGDLLSLTPENQSHYRKRFTLLDELQQKYDIYHHFQYSGVPSPTDFGWHWWGKLNDTQGAIVVLRGLFGLPNQRINIPWVNPTLKYRVRACFQEKILGEYSGIDLQKGKIKLSLPRLGQEILEISKV